jgi:outer membrane protein assembly factor BamA
VQAARVVANGDKVRIYIEVEQGPATTVESLFVVGATGDVRDAIADDVKNVLPLGSPLDEDKLAAAEKVALGALTKRGHAAAKVERSAEVDLATQKARITFKVTPGRVVAYGPVSFQGLVELPEDAVRRVFGVEETQRYDSSQLEESRQALLDLGVFANVEVVVDEEEGERTGIAPVLVRCEESKLRALLVGIGAEFDQLKTDVHLIGGWQSTNFLGGLRRLDVRFKPGIVLYPMRLTAPIPAPEKPLYEHRLSATLRQPAFFEKRLTAVGYAEYSVFPVLLPLPDNVERSENVLGYHELRGEVGVERPFFGTKLLLAPRYGAQANFPFDYLGKTGDIDPLQISYVELNASLDLRDDPLRPRKGLWLGGEIQRAGSFLQGDAVFDCRAPPGIPKTRGSIICLRKAEGRCS